MKTIVRISLVALALGVASTQASAQLAGVPIDYAPVSAGIGINGLVGYGVNDESGKAFSAGGMLTYGTPTFFIGAGVGMFDLGTKVVEEAIFNFGGKAGYNLSLPETMPLSLGIVAGANYWSKDGLKSLSIPAGVSVGIKMAGSPVTPWVSPQFRYNRMSFEGVSASASNFGVSGGVKFMLGMLGVNAMADYDAESKGFLVGGALSVAIPQ
jgi:hypothetical protein